MSPVTSTLLSSSSLVAMVVVVVALWQWHKTKRQVYYSCQFILWQGGGPFCLLQPLLVVMAVVAEVINFGIFSTGNGNIRKNTPQPTTSHQHSVPNRQLKLLTTLRHLNIICQFNYNTTKLFCRDHKCLCPFLVDSTQMGFFNSAALHPPLRRRTMLMFVGSERINDVFMTKT